MDRMTLGQRIRDRRQQLGLKQADIARAVGVQPQSMYRIETDQVSNPGVELVARIAEELRCSLDFLVKGEGPPETAGSNA
jgi:transcriptional regulator with XRE-family HTH domain